MRSVDWGLGDHSLALSPVILVSRMNSETRRES
jgi:hypothetical protein